MIELRRCESDADLEAWRSVRIAVVPYERTDSVEELRRSATPDRLMLLAYRGGELAGSGVAGRGDTASGFAIPRVLPEQRRHGVGTDLLYALAAHVEALGYPDLGVGTDDEGSLAFARRFGFEEVGRQVEQVRTVGADESPPSVPHGIEIVSLAARPELHARTYHELALAAFDDIPTPRKIQITLDDWEKDWVPSLEGSFAALAGDEIVGCAGLIRDVDRPERAENTLTAVRRDWRGRGLARALKETVLAWASVNGIGEVYTWTQTGNENMQAVNARLGYVTRHVSISLRRPLPLPPIGIELPIQTERLVIRPLELADAKDLGESDEWIREKIDRFEREGGMSLWAAVERESGRAVALAGLQWEQIDGSRELDLGCVVASDAQQRGYGTEASEAIVRTAFAAGFERITAMTYPDNAPALRVLEKLEFTPEGETIWEGRRYAFFVRSSAR